MQQRIEQLVDAQGLLGIETLAEVLPLEHLSDCEPPREPDDVAELEVVEPLALPADLGLRLIDDMEELAHISVRVRFHLFRGEHGPHDRLAGRVADPRRPVSHDQHNLMTHLLQRSQLSQENRMPDVKVRLAGVKAQLEAQLLAGLQRLS